MVRYKFIYSPGIPIGPVYINYLHILALTVSSPWAESKAFSAVGAIHTVPILVSPGTLYCCLDRDRVDFKACPRLVIHDRCCRNRTPDP